MKNSAMQLYCWQEQKIRMGSCKVIFLEGIEKSDDVTGETAGDRSRLLPVIQNSAMQLYYWQEQKTRMGSCKVILLKRH